MGCKRYLSLLVIVSKEFVGYLLAAIGPIALGKIYDVCHSWTMPLVLLQAGDTVVFKDLYRFTREAENGYKKYMEWLDRGINMVFLDNPTVSSDYIRQMMTTAEQQDIVTKTAMESIIKLLIIVELDRGEVWREKRNTKGNAGERNCTHSEEGASWKEFTNDCRRTGRKRLFCIF